MSEHPQPLLLISLADVTELPQAYAALRSTFRCELEAVGILMIDRLEDGTITLRRDARADQAYREAVGEASQELLRAEAQGVVATLNNRHLSRPNPNELETYARLGRLLLDEDPAGGESGKRLVATNVVPVFDTVLQEEGLLDLLIGRNKTRKLYNALRDSVPGIVIEQDSHGGRTYFSGVTWSAEALERYHPPKFKGPYD